MSSIDSASLMVETELVARDWSRCISILTCADGAKSSSALVMLVSRLCRLVSGFLEAGRKKHWALALSCIDSRLPG